MLLEYSSIFLSDSDCKEKSPKNSQVVIGGNQTALDNFHYHKKERKKQKNKYATSKFTVQCVCVFNLTIQ